MKKPSLVWMELNNEHFGVYKGVIRYSIEDHSKWGLVCWRWKLNKSKSEKLTALRFTTVDRCMKWAEKQHQQSTSRK